MDAGGRASRSYRAGFVQARWVYTNGAESTLTRVQEISLNYHIRCEQYARFAAGLFFNFNGTAGVWRRRCIVDAGGWNNRTTAGFRRPLTKQSKPPSVVYVIYPHQ